MVVGVRRVQENRLVCRTVAVAPANVRTESFSSAFPGSPRCSCWWVCSDCGSSRWRTPGYKGSERCRLRSSTYDEHAGCKASMLRQLLGFRSSSDPGSTTVARCEELMPPPAGDALGAGRRRDPRSGCQSSARRRVRRRTASCRRRPRRAEAEEGIRLDYHRFDGAMTTVAATRQRGRHEPRIPRLTRAARGFRPTRTST